MYLAEVSVPLFGAIDDFLADMVRYLASGLMILHSQVVEGIISEHIFRLTHVDVEGHMQNELAAGQFYLLDHVLCFAAEAPVGLERPSVDELLKPCGRKI